MSSLHYISISNKEMREFLVPNVSSGRLDAIADAKIGSFHSCSNSIFLSH